MKIHKASKLALFVGISSILVGCGGQVSGEKVTSENQGSLPSSDSIRPNPRPYMIGSDRRMAVVYESWFALRRSYLQTPNSTGPTDGLTLKGRVASDWNYIGSDPNAFTQVRGVLSSNSSVCTYFGTGDDYGMKQSQNGIRYGRGGQCTYFANLILYRALGGFQFSSNASAGSGGRFVWADLSQSAYPKATEAQPGDLVFIKSGVWHIAVCVRRPSSTSMEVVESNYTGYGESTHSVGIYNGTHNSELIARRIINFTNDDANGYRAIPGDGRYPNLKHRRWY